MGREEVINRGIYLATHLGMMPEEEASEAWQQLCDSQVSRSGLVRWVLRVMVAMRDHGIPVHRRSMRGVYILARTAHGGTHIFFDVDDVFIKDPKQGEIHIDIDEALALVKAQREMRPVYDDTRYTTTIR